jgi:cyclopropane-fatty-acyl-phospholipid synthase
VRRTERAGSPDLRWPHLATTPRNPVRAALAKRIFLHALADLPLSVVLPDGTSVGRGAGRFAEGGDPALVINDEDVFFTRVGRDGALGFGEAHLLGAWDCGTASAADAVASDELVAWLKVFGEYLRPRESRVLYLLRRLWYSAHPVSDRDGVAAAVGNVQAHYDLDPRLFGTFLDESMTYSSAWFEPGDDLAAAQARKIDAILDLAGVGPGKRVLDIGSGFGGLAVRAARQRAADVTGITLSQKQFEHATALAGRLGLASQVRFSLEDFRRCSGTYDAIVSVEMLEAVGAANWRTYFEVVDRLLADDGRFALQVITFPHRKMVVSRNDFSWVDRYVFPGGALPSLREIDRILDSHTSLEVTATRRLTASYARTLREWRHRFAGQLATVTSLGFDATFCRLWVLYFAYFEASFRSRYCDVWQLGVRKRS